MKLNLTPRQLALEVLSLLVTLVIVGWLLRSALAVVLVAVVAVGVRLLVLRGEARRAQV